MTRVTEIAGSAGPNDSIDPRAALFRDSRDADLRGRYGLFLVESEPCVRRWLAGVERRRAGEPLPPALGVQSLLLSRSAYETLRVSIEAAGVEQVFVADSAFIEQLSGFDHHHGVLGLGRRTTPDEETSAALLDTIAASTAPLVVTDGVVHVDNMGSIFRNAAALGAAGVLLSGRCADPLVRKTIRISMGHVFAVPWAVAPDLAAVLALMRARGRRVLVAENVEGAIDVDDIGQFDAPSSAIVFGAEGHGVSPAVLAMADAVIRIPSREGVPLNVAVASAIVLHELGRAERQRSASRK